MPTIEDLYTQKNNELVDNFLKTLTSTAVSRRQVSNSLIEHWKCVIKLPYNDTNVNLFLVSSCNLVLSQILYDYNQLGCAEVVHVCYKAIRKIVWCEPSSLYHNHLAESTCDLLHEITEMLDTFINDEKMFVKAGSTVVYLCTLTYLFCMNESLLESIKKALNKRAALQNDCYSDCNELFLLMPSHHVPVQSNQEQISRSIFGFARLITGIDSSRNGQETKTEILPHYTQASISLSRQLSKTIPPVVSHEFLRCLHQGPIFPCLSSSLVATHLQSSTKPALVIKLIR